MRYRVSTRRTLSILALCILSLSAAVVFFQPAPAEAQTSARVLQRLHLEAENVPDIRVLFYEEDEGQPCVGLGILEGPNPMRPGFLVFQVRESEDAKPERLKFEFDKKNVQNEGGLRMWTSCVEPGVAEVEPGHLMQVTVRRPRKSTETYVVEFPRPGMAAGVDLWNVGDGRMKPVQRVETLSTEG